ncbi:MAG: peptide deformylase [Sphaerochaetaceae bacterium]|nr:peptide deformylase [Sphaerochaetaceae bacterium]
MIKPICKDLFFLSQKSEVATISDKQVGQDLLDTLQAHRDECVGMAANMIGVLKNIIVVNMDFFNLVMFNPIITKKAKPFETEEGCLSLIGVRKTTRYEEITVEFQDMRFNRHIQNFNGWTAQIIQHEIDHLNGIII